MNKLILFSAALLFISLSSFAQLSSVRGEVSDSKTDTPLPGATVFIANTTKGTATDADGRFEIPGLPANNYDLVVSFIGYETQVLNVVPGDPVTYQVKLKQTTKVLSEVIVRSRKLSAVRWKTALTKFKHNFIGISENASHCILMNPKDLYFDTEGDEFKALADTTLLLKNTGLGYLVRVNLDLFSYNAKKTLVHFEGQTHFEKLKPRNEKEKIRWAKNRLKAYYGSMMHFVRALNEHRLNEEGYYFTILNRPTKTDTILLIRPSVFGGHPRQIPTMTDYDNITRVVDGKQVLSFNGIMQVVYVNEEEPAKYQRARRKVISKAFEFSALQMHAPALIIPDGRLYPVNTVESSGYWSWELMAESLPLDYDPAEDLKITGSNPGSR